MTPQAKTLLAGGATLAVSHFYFKKDWKTAATYAAIAITAYLVVTMLPDEIV